MGLAEKRVVAALESESWPVWQKNIVEACGGDALKFTVEWDKIVREKAIEAYPKVFEINFVSPLIAALKSVCADKIGKDAFTAQIKAIKMTSNTQMGSLKAKVEGDTLVLDCDPMYRRQEKEAMQNSKSIQDALEKAL